MKFFQKSRKLYVTKFKLAGFAGSGEKISFNIRAGISTQGPKTFIFSALCDRLFYAILLDLK